LLATLTIDTSGLNHGEWNLNLRDTLNGPTDFAGTAATIVDGSITIVSDSSPQLMAGDADQDLDFDQFDLVQVQVAGKYLTGQPATWGEGDWNGAPAEFLVRVPEGDGVFNQLDIVAAQQAGLYLSGPYAADRPGDTARESPVSVDKDVILAESWIEPLPEPGLTSIDTTESAYVAVPEPSTLMLGVTAALASTIATAVPRRRRSIA
jgi:hypothetical protein